MERKLGQPPQHIKKQTHHLADKSPCDSWTIKKAECQRTEVFELWCQRRLLKVAWTARRSNQSILKKIIPEYSLEGLMLRAEVSMLLPSDVNSQLTGKDFVAGKD